MAIILVPYKVEKGKENVGKFFVLKPIDNDTLEFHRGLGEVIVKEKEVPTDHELAVEITVRYITNNQYRKSKVAPMLKAAFVDGFLFCKEKLGIK